MSDEMIATQLVQEGVIALLNDGLMKCTVCVKRKLMSRTKQVVNHLNGTSHKETAARFAMIHPDSAPKSFLKLLLPHTRKAVEKRIIGETASGNVMCTECEVTLTGTQQIEEHLVGNDHNKKVNDVALLNQSIAARPLPAVVASPPPNQESAKPKASPNVAAPFKQESTKPKAVPKVDESFRQTIVTQLVQEGVIALLNDGLMKCTVCVKRKLMSRTKQVVNHLNGTSHKETAARFAMIHPDSAPKSFLKLLLPHTRKAVEKQIFRETASRSVMCTVCEVPLTGTQQIEEHLVGNDHNKKVNDVALLNQSIAGRPLPAVVASPPPNQTQPAWGGQDDDEELITRAQVDGVVRLTDNIAQTYVCDPCSKRFIGKKTLLEHLKSKLHKKNEGVSSNVIPAGVPRVQPGSVMAYSVKSLPRGHVYVFNNIFQGQGKPWYRKGAEIDSRNLKSVFKEMGYLVTCHENLNKANTMEMMGKIQNNTSLSNVDSLIIFILSHGKDPYTFHTNDQKEVSLVPIRKKFTDSECPAMKGKPKIFLTNYCRGSKMEKREEDGSSMEVPSDMVTIHAAAEGVVALRTATRGTYFVDSLYKVLKSYGRLLDLRGVYSQVYETMKEHNSTKPMWEDYGFIKSFSFNPV